jgi:hypothetical protein
LLDPVPFLLSLFRKWGSQGERDNVGNAKQGKAFTTHRVEVAEMKEGWTKVVWALGSRPSPMGRADGHVGIAEVNSNLRR